MKILFIDRDGVINKDPGGWTKHNYVTDPKDLRFIPGSLEALKQLRNRGYKVIIVSNQGGISKGYFSVGHLDRVNKKMMDEVSKAGGEILEAFYCVHKDEDNCDCRKPKTGLLEMAAKKYGFNPRDAYFVGDSHVDVTAGKILGTKTIFVLSGKFTVEDVKTWRDKPSYIFKDLKAAVSWILEKDKRKAIRASKREE